MENITPHAHVALAYTENDVASHATDIFRPIAQEVSMKGTVLVAIRPTGGDNQTGPYDFKIMQRGDMYIQTSQMRLYMKMKVQKHDGTLPGDTDGVGICNLAGNSLFKNMEIQIGGNTIADLQNSHSNYKTYLETLLTYSREARNSHLNASCWQIDTAKYLDDVKYGVNTDTDKELNTQNTGLVDRRKMIATPFDICFPLHFDFFNCDRLFPPGVSYFCLSNKIPR